MLSLLCKSRSIKVTAIQLVSKFWLLLVQIHIANQNSANAADVVADNMTTIE